eukprot:Skav219114  [mRNA]  locus=scaffold1574:367358:372836:+ [translate_table: standard]
MFFWNSGIRRAYREEHDNQETQRWAKFVWTRPRQSSNSVAAVPAPLPLGAVGGLQHAHSSAGSLWAWVVAAGGAIHGVRQSHEARHTRRNRTQLVPNQAASIHEDGWQTASEDEGGLTRQTSEVPEMQGVHHGPWSQGMTSMAQPFGMDFSQAWPMMPMVMVAMPQEEVSHAQGAQPGGTAPPPAPFSPGQLERGTTATSESSSWASASGSVASSSRWSNRDCDWISKQLMKQGPPRREAIQQVIQDVWTLANSKNGTRVVQTALDVADYAEKQSLAYSFQGRVWVALKSPHANHVLQKIIALMPPEKIQFVIDASRQSGHPKEEPWQREMQLLRRSMDENFCKQLTILNDLRSGKGLEAGEGRSSLFSHNPTVNESLWRSDSVMSQSVTSPEAEEVCSGVSPLCLDQSLSPRDVPIQEEDEELPDELPASNEEPIEEGNKEV